MSYVKKFIRLSFGLIAVCMAPIDAFAGSASGSLAVTATVVAGCTVSASALAFGAYSGSQLDATATINTICTNGTTYTIALGAGSGGSSTTTRAMTEPVASNTLAYSLYKDSGRTQNWGMVVGTDTVAMTGNGSTQNTTVYGRITVNQPLKIGAYTDTIGITVAY